MRQKFPETKELNAHLRAGNELAETIPLFVSIDEALHYWSGRPEITKLGKLAIAEEILKAEASSNLAIDPSSGQFDVSRADTTWLSEFFMMATAAIRREEVENIFKNVTFINFNYDRTLEHYLYFALQSRAAVGSDVARNCIRNLLVIRPYGSVGPLEWQEQESGIQFADTRRNPFEVSDAIRTYTEQHREANSEENIDKALESAELVVFLGFGFHSQNLALFRPRSGSSRPRIRRVIASVVGIDSANHDSLLQKLESELGLRPRAQVLDRKCSPLLSSLRPMIMMSVG